MTGKPLLPTGTDHKAHHRKTQLRVAAWLVVPVVVLFIGSQIAHNSGQSVNWYAGFGQWLGALGSFTAAGAALWISVSDRGERKREREAEAQAQANLVVVTVSDASADGTFGVEVANHGDWPLLDVEFEAAHYIPIPSSRVEFGSRAPRRIQVLANGDPFKSVFTLFDGEEPVFEGGRDRYGNWQSSDHAATSGSNVSVTIRWQDAHGRDWKLTHPGRPSREC